MKPFEALRELKAWGKKYEIDFPELEALANRLISSLEELPIHNPEDVSGWTPGFILVANEWWPVNVLNELKNGWAEWRIDYKNGSESGVSQPFNWAHCSADNRPCVVFEEENIHG